MKFIENVKRLFRKSPSAASRSMEAGMQASDPRMAQKILGMLAMTQEKELGCDDVFALLDQFAEMAARGEDIARLMPMVQQHLDLCGDCREEYEALMNVITNQN